MKPGGICVLAFACLCQSTVTSAVLALVEALRTVITFHLFFSFNAVVRVQIWEFRIALNKIVQAVKRDHRHFQDGRWFFLPKQFVQSYTSG